MDDFYLPIWFADNATLHLLRFKDLPTALPNLGMVVSAVHAWWIQALELPHWIQANERRNNNVVFDDTHIFEGRQFGKYDFDPQYLTGLACTKNVGFDARKTCWRTTRPRLLIDESALNNRKRHGASRARRNLQTSLVLCESEVVWDLSIC